MEGPFIVEGVAQGVLLSFEKSSLAVHASIPPSATAGVPISGLLRLHTNDPDSPLVTIPLSVTPRGATLIMPTGPVEFGDIPVSATSPTVVGSILNVGNAPAEVVVGLPSDPQFVAQTKTLSLLPGAKDDVAMTFSPTTWATVSASLPITVKGAVCGALPVMALRGRGTKGVVLTSPGSLDFGLVDCGATAAPKKVTVENKGDASFDVDAVLSVGTSFAVTPAKSTVAPGQAIELTVTPTAVPQVSAVTPDLYGDTLTVTTNAVGDFPHVISLHETAQGAILNLTLPSTPIRARVDDVKLVPVTISNAGNAGGTAWLTTPNNALRITAAGALPGTTATTNLEVRADPEKLGVDDPETLTWSTTAPICGTNVVSGTVHAYDSAIDAAFWSQDRCVIGHAHRLYCWGPNQDQRLPFPNAPQPITPRLVQGETPDQVAVEGDAFSLRAGSSVKRIKYYGSTLDTVARALPSVFAQAFHSEGGGNFHWCALSAQGTLACVGTTGNGGQWANGGDCAQSSSTPVAAYPGVVPIQSYAADDHWSFVLTNGELWTNSASNTFPLPCTSGPPTKVVGITDAIRVSTGNGFACAVRATGAVACWDWSTWSAPQTVVGISDAVDVVADGGIGCVKRTSGVVRCWSSVAQPVDVPGLVAPSQFFSNSGNAMCALRPDGILGCSVNLAPFQPVVGFEGP